MKAPSHKLLLDEPVIALHPRVARELGPESAILLQQLHFRSRGQSHAGGLWTVVHKGDESWVSWSTEGRQFDIPLARVGPGNGEAAYRRVVDCLVREGLIHVSQLLKSNWNRSNFLRLDYAAFSARFHDSGDEAPLRADETYGSTDLGRTGSNASESTAHLQKELEKDTRESVSTNSLSSILDPFVSRRNGDDPNRDRRRLREVEKLVSDGDLTLEDVQKLASDATVCFASSLVERSRELAKARRLELDNLARTSREKSQNEVLAIAAHRQATRVDDMRRKVEKLRPADLESLCNFICEKVTPITLRNRVVSAIRSRAIDMPHIAAAAVQPFEEWSETSAVGAAHV